MRAGVGGAGDIGVLLGVVAPGDTRRRNPGLSNKLPLRPGADGLMGPVGGVLEPGWGA